jgi:hypothetical protein
VVGRREGRGPRDQAAADGGGLGPGLSVEGLRDPADDMTDFVPEEAIDYDAIFRRGGQNYGDEGFALFRCPSCAYIYLLEYEVDTVYLDPNDLSRRVDVVSGSFDCVRCGQEVPGGVSLWVGSNASPRFGVTWEELEASPWSWAARRPRSDA